MFDYRLIFTCDHQFAQIGKSRAAHLALHKSFAAEIDATFVLDLLFRTNGGWFAAYHHPEGINLFD